MKRTIKIIAGASAAFGLAFGGVAASADIAQANTKWGCPDGYVCVYDEETFNDYQPDQTYYTYGVHQLYGQYGKHIVVNNQTGGAKLTLNTGWNGSGVKEKVKAGHATTINLTPINSVSLSEG